MALQHKTFRAYTLKAETGDPEGTVRAIVSVFNNVDRAGEKVLPGFFTESLSKRTPKGVWMHDWTLPVAKTVEAKELQPGDPLLPEDLKELGGLYVKGLFNLDTQRGREAYSDIKFGTIDEYSIGYEVTSDRRDSKGVRELVKGDLYEWSPVLVGCNPATATLSVKQRPDRSGSPAAPEFKGQYLGSYVEQSMTMAAIRAANDALFWNLFYDCIYDYDGDEDLATRLTTLRAGLEEFRDLVLMVAERLLSGTGEEDAETASAEAKRLWPRADLSTKAVPAPAAGQAFETQLKTALAAVQGCLTRGQAIQAKRAESGRTLSAERGEQIGQLAGALGELKALCGSHVETPAAPPADCPEAKTAEINFLLTTARHLGVGV